ncbi:MAG: choice-of-anchor Q domain-containing protein, partial [Candidatus Methylacidiphilales bacterium]
MPSWPALRLYVTTVLVISFAMSPPFFFNGAVLRANPSGGTVVGGSATITNPGAGQVTVNQSSQRAVVNWQQFSIKQGETTTFVQPSSSSATLNRVTGGQMSQLNGRLNANGKVYLVNPQGVVVGKTGRVNTGGGFTASTLDVSDQEFLAGKGMTFKGSSSASVVNQGKIKAANGDVMLIARQVENQGKITARNGEVHLTGGQEVLVQPSGTTGQRVYIKSGSGSVSNSGTIRATAAELRAAGGNEYALAVNNTGVIRATTVDKSGGRIVLKAEQRDAASGTGGGTVQNSGKLIARGTAPGRNGGRVTVTGDQVRLTKTSSIDASSTYAKGGEVNIGGGFQGRDAAISNARTTVVEAGSVINVDGRRDAGLGNGDPGQGGTAVIWSDERTDFLGGITARDGGFAEVSSKGVLNFAGAVNTGGGTLLLDPASITISNGLTTSGTPTFSSIDSVLNVTDLVSLLASGNVTLQAANFITVNAAITSVSARNLIFDTSTLYLNQAISLGGGAVSGTSSLINVWVNPTGSIQNGIDAVATGGNVHLGGGTFAPAATLNVGKSITISGTGADTTIIDGLTTKRVFSISSNVTLESLGVTRGNAASGGGIVVNSGSFNLSNAKVYNNESTTTGGGILILSGGNHVFRNVEISANRAAGSNGGGMYVQRGTLTITDSLFSNNSAGSGAGLYLWDPAATVSNSTFRLNVATANGGGITMQNNGTLRISGSTFSQNDAANGGAIQMRSSSTPLTIANSVFTTNRALSGSGGAISSEPFAVGGTITISGSTFTGNTASDDGGAIAARGTQSNITIKSSAFTSNTANTFLASGGAFSNLGTATITDSTFTTNTSQRGGAVANIGSGAILTISGSTFTGNSVQGGGGVSTIINNGGTIYNESAQLQLSDSLILTRPTDAAYTTGTAARGGGIYIKNSATAVGITNTTISGNFATDTGGGIYTENSVVTINGSVISNNRSTNFGGGIKSLDASNVTLTDSVLDGNTGSLGGGIESADTSRLAIYRSSIIRNSANSGGGGIWVRSRSQPVIIENSTVAQNRSIASGAGIVVAELTVVNLTSSTIVDNQVTGGVGYAGGGIYLGAATTSLVIGNTIVALNTADGEADIHNPNGSLITNAGYNRVGSGAIVSFTGDVTSATGVTAAQLKLAPLGYYGGKTPTYALMTGSTAYNTGDSTLAGTTDQRGRARNANAFGLVDIGAFEAHDDTVGNQYVVTTTYDYNPATPPTPFSNVAGSLRFGLQGDLIEKPNAISFNIPTSDSGYSSSTGRWTITTAGVQFNINRALYIDGKTQPGGIPTAGPAIVISGNNVNRVFNVLAGSGNQVNLDALEITRGRMDGSLGAGILLSTGMINLFNSVLSNNTAHIGGAIFVSATTTLMVERSLFYNNVVTDFGGGIYSQGVARVFDSTFAQNRAQGTGGSAIDSVGIFELRRSTVAYNINDMSGYGAVTLNGGTVTIGQSLFSHNTSDLFRIFGTLANGGFSVLENDGTLSFTGGATGNILVTDALLAPLGYYGGYTRTYGLLPGSPALNFVPAGFITGGSGDQRGVARGQGSGGNGSVGAFESRQNYTVTTTADYNPTGPVAVDGSLRFGLALNSAGLAEAATIRFNIANTDRGYDPVSGRWTITAATGSTGFNVTNAVLINGATQTGYSSATGPLILVNGNQLGAVFNIAPGSLKTAELNALGITNGSGWFDGAYRFGGGIYATGGNLTINDSWIYGNNPELLTIVSGGGIWFNGGGALTINGSRVFGNTAYSIGGGIAVMAGTATINNSSITNNAATSVPDSFGMGGSAGGGIYIETAATLSLNSSSVSNNSVAGSGAAITLHGEGILTDSLIFANRSGWGGGGIVTYDSTALTLIRTSVIGNSSSMGGAGIRHYSTGKITITDSILSGNHATARGGGILFDDYAATIVEITGTTFAFNTADRGGAIFAGQNAGTTFDKLLLVANTSITNGGAFSLSGIGLGTMTDSFAIGNRSVDGGAFFTAAGTSLTITGSTLAGNSATGRGGAISSVEALTINSSALRGNNADFGGALYFVGSNVTITGSTLSHNHAGVIGGAIYKLGTGVISLNLSTIARNTNTAVYANAGSMTISSSTISQNSGSGAPGGVNVQAGTAIIFNSIISGNGGTFDLDANYQAYTDGGYNLIGTTGIVTTFTQPTTITGITNPLLAPLGFYGGPLETMALLPGSLALGKADPALAGTLDQRGVTRDSAPDIGAYESRGFTYTITGGDNQSAIVGTAFAQPLTVSVVALDTLLTDLTGGTITLTVPGAGATATGVLTQPVALSGGTYQSSFSLTAGMLPGTYGVGVLNALPTAPALSFTLTNLAIAITLRANAGQGKVYGNADPATYGYTILDAGGTPVFIALGGTLTRQA